MDASIGAAPRKGGWKRSPVLAPAARRRGTGPADRLRERRESPACARQREGARNGCSPSARCRADAADEAVADGEFISFFTWRDRWPGDSFLCEGISAAHRAGQIG